MSGKKLILVTAVLLLMIFSGCKAKKLVVNIPEPEKYEVLNEKPEKAAETVKVEEEIIEEEGVISPVRIAKKGPFVMREFRAAWIATVANINWPSKPGLSTKEQQREALVLLDFLKEHNYNAVIFQVRPQADALYESDLEPWSFFLSGVEGQAPDPYYDPLNFWIEAAHDRGMELHVWLNPYRAHHTTGGKITETSVVKTHPELVVELKNGMWWMDPSLKATQDYTSAVVMDLVKRYDIDGVHFDDYFYSYASYNKGEDFPDAASYLTYQNTGGELSRSNWRREGVNIFVERIYNEIKAEKPLVKFGISPFGIWRPGYPKSIAGMDQYDELYADARLWLNKGWIDYFSPQLYWKINQTKQSFPVLLGWWESENTQNRHLWPGINIDFGGGKLNLDETVNQIMLTRGMLPTSMGSVHWSISPLIKYPAMAAGILAGPYKKDALVPASPWLSKIIPDAPTVVTEIIENKVMIKWENLDPEEVFRWVVYYEYAGVWNYEILNRTFNSFELSQYLNKKDQKNPLTNIGVTAIGRTGNESDFIEMAIGN